MDATRVIEDLLITIDNDIKEASQKRRAAFSWSKNSAEADGGLRALAKVKIRVEMWQRAVQRQIERSRVQDLISL